MRREEGGEARAEAVDFCRLGLALPNDEHAPAEAAEVAQVFPIAGGVVLDFGEPVFAACGGNAAAAAGVHVPEAAVDEDDFFEAQEDEVWRAG